MPCALWSMEKTQKEISRLSFDRKFLIPSCLQSCLFPLRDGIIYCFRFIYSNSCRSMKIMTLIMFNKGFLHLAHTFLSLTYQMSEEPSDICDNVTIFVVFIY